MQVAGLVTMIQVASRHYESFKRTGMQRSHTSEHFLLPAILRRLGSDVVSDMAMWRRRHGTLPFVVVANAETKKNNNL